MSKKRRKTPRDPRNAASHGSTPVSTPPAMAGLDATTWSPNRALPWWPSLDPAQEVSAYDLQTLYRLGRSLYANHPAVAMLVDTLVNLTGPLKPLPCSSDPQWNEQARAAFTRRAENEFLFERSGRLDFAEVQEWLMRRALVDGDALLVMTTGQDLGAQVALFDAPQVSGGPYAGSGNEGTALHPSGGIAAFFVANRQDPERGPRRIHAANAALFTLQPDPARTRTPSPLGRAANDALDLKDLHGYLKAGLKLAASFALVEKKPAEDARSNRQGMFSRAAILRRSGASEEEVAAAEAEDAAAAQAGARDAATLFRAGGVLGGVQVASLPGGHELQVLHDNRPSNEAQAFVDKVLRNVSWSLGVPHEAVLEVAKLGSASTRATLELFKRALQNYRRSLRKVCQRVYRHFLNCEIAAGRLPVPSHEDYTRCLWVSPPDLTIDRGRDVTGTINGVREGLIPADDWTLATSGLTFRDIVRSRIAELSDLRNEAAAAGFSLAEILPGALGATAPTAAPSAPGNAQP